MGIICYGMFVLAHAHLITFVSSPSPKPASAAAILQYLSFLPGSVIFLPPSILEELHSLGREAVKTAVEGTRLILYGGAPLNVSVGNALSGAGLRFSTAYGS